MKTNFLRENRQYDDKIIATIQVELSENNVIPIYIKQFDNAHLVAVNFCKSNNLNQIAVSIIEKKIADAQRSYTVNKLEQKQLNLSPLKDLNSNNKLNKSVYTNKSISQTNLNVYQKGILQNQKLQKFCMRQRLQQQKQQLKQLSFKPKINKISEKIVQYRRQGNLTPPKKKSIEKNIVKQLEGCTFQPQINKIYQQVVRHKNRDQQVQILKLYNNEIKQQKITSQFTYKPLLNSKSTKKITQNFMQRLEKSIQNKKKILQANNLIDQQCSFTPKINRKPKQFQNINDKKQQRNKQNSKSNRKQKSNLTPNKKISDNLINKSSVNIYQNMLEERIEELFQIFDQDRDGLISFQSIELQSLPDNTFTFLQPLLQQLRLTNIKLDYKMFKKAMLRLFQTSDLSRKGKFLRQKWQKKTIIEFSFTPQINTKSKKILLDKNKIDLYEENLIRKKKLQILMNNQKIRKQQQELKECSFKPKLNPISKKISKEKKNVNLQK